MAETLTRCLGCAGPILPADTVDEGYHLHCKPTNKFRLVALRTALVSGVYDPKAMQAVGEAEGQIEYLLNLITEWCSLRDRSDIPEAERHTKMVQVESAMRDVARGRE